MLPLLVFARSHSPSNFFQRYKKSWSRSTKSVYISRLSRSGNTVIFCGTSWIRKGKDLWVPFIHPRNLRSYTLTGTKIPTSGRNHLEDFRPISQIFGSSWKRRIFDSSLNSVMARTPTAIQSKSAPNAGAKTPAAVTKAVWISTDIKDAMVRLNPQTNPIDTSFRIFR